MSLSKYNPLPSQIDSPPETSSVMKPSEAEVIFYRNSYAAKTSAHDDIMLLGLQR